MIEVIEDNKKNNVRVLIEGVFFEGAGLDVNIAVEGSAKNVVSAISGTMLRNKTFAALMVESVGIYIDNISAKEKK